MKILILGAVMLVGGGVGIKVFQHQQEIQQNAIDAKFHGRPEVSELEFLKEIHRARGSKSEFDRASSK